MATTVAGRNRRGFLDLHKAQKLESSGDLKGGMYGMMMMEVALFRYHIDVLKATFIAMTCLAILSSTLQIFTFGAWFFLFYDN